MHTQPSLDIHHNSDDDDQKDSESSPEHLQAVTQPVQEYDEGEDPELLLDMINKPPPIERGGKKPKFQFFGI